MRSSTLLLLPIFFMLFGCNKPVVKKKAYSYKYEMGEYYWKIYKLDSAYQLLNEYVEKTSDTLRKGKAYWMMGESQWNLRDFYGAEESLTGTLKTLDPTNEKHFYDLAIAYNILGNVSLDLKHNDEAIDYYNKAATFARDSFLLDVMNGKATAFQKMGRYNEAIAVYDSAIVMNPADQQAASRLIDNRARTKWLQDPTYNPLPEFWTALKIRTDSSYNLGLNASYAHLSEYYTKSNRDSAFVYARKMYRVANDNQSPDDVLEAIDKLIRLTKSPDSMDRWYIEYKNLSDSLLYSRDTTKSRFAPIRYGVQKSKMETLEARQDAIQKEFWIYALIALTIFVATGLTAWYDKRRKRIKQESEIAIRTSKLKTSQKVHDVVANGLYGIMNELEHKTTIDKEPLINKIEDLYEKSRNISQEDPVAENIPDYDQQVHELLTAFSNEETSVFVVGNQPVFWNEITRSQKQQLKLVLTELMVNMKKHSGAKNVVVQFKTEDGLAHIHYKDDGVGFSNDAAGPGKGLENTVSRINSLHGKITFGKNEKGGVSVAINFPTQS